MVGWHHRLSAHEFELALGDGEGQGSLTCCSPWDLQRVGHNWATEHHHHFISLNENEIISILFYLNLSVNILYNNSINYINCNLFLRNCFSNFYKSLLFFCLVCVSHSILSDSLKPHWLYLLGSSAHRILQTRILEWIASSFSRRSSWPRIKPGSPTLLAEDTIWTTR